MEGELKSLKTLKDQYQKKNYEQVGHLTRSIPVDVYSMVHISHHCPVCFQSELIQQFRSETLSLQRELRRLSSSQEGELEAERELRHVMQDKCQVSRGYVSLS